MEKLQNNTINGKAFYRSALGLIIPIALQNLINVGIQSADVIMLGKVGETALSGASLAGQVQFVMSLIFFGLSSGAAVLTAQYWGKGDVRAIEKVMSIALRLAVGSALVFALAALLIPAQVMRIFTPNEEVVQQGVRYLRVVAPSYLLMGFTNVYLNILRSVERVIISTAVYTTSFFVNIALNAIFIFGLLGMPAMGTQGAALATASARVLEMVIVVVYIIRNPVLRLHRKDFFTTHKVLFRDFMKYSGPTILNEMLWGLAMATNAVIIGHLGVEATAANSVGQVIRQLATVVCFGVANAAAIMIGKAIGAGEPDKARWYASRFLRLAVGTGLAGSVVILVLRAFILNIMNLSPMSQSYLLLLMLVLSAYVVAQAANGTMVIGFFRAGGDPKFGLILDCCSMWFVTLPLGALAAFVFHLPVPVVFFILFADEFIKLPFSIARYRSKKWLRDVTRPTTD